MENFTKAIELETLNKDIYYVNRAYFVHEETGNYDLAIEDYNQAIFHNPENADHYFYRANLFSDMKEYDEALKDYEKVLELDSTNTNSINNRAVIYDEIGKTELAIKEIEKIIKIRSSTLLQKYSNILLHNKSI